MPNEEKRRTNNFLRVFLTATLVLSFFTAAFFAASVILSKPDSSLMLKTDWEYASGTTARTNSLNENDWTAANNGKSPLKSDEDTYLYLKGELPAGGDSNLYLKASNASYKVTLDGEVIHDGLKQGAFLAPSDVTRIKTGVSYEKRELEIIAYVPFSNTVSVYFSENNKAFSSLSRLPYADFWFAGLCLVLCFISFLKLHLKTEHGFKITVLDSLPAVFLLTALSTVLKSFSYPDILFNIEIACTLFSYLLCLFGLIAAHRQWDKAAEKLLTVNFVYVFTAVFLPYKIFLPTVLRLAIIIQTVNAVFLAVRLFKFRHTADAGKSAAMFVLTVSNLAFWYALSSGNIGNTAYLFNDSVLVFAAYGIFTARVVKRVKVKPRKAVTDFSISEIEPNKSAPVVLKLAGTDEKSSDTCLIYTDFESCPRAYNAVKTIAYKGIGTDKHALHVAEYTRIICSGMGMCREKTELISDAALLHDIGKIAVPADILHKSRLTEEEFKEIKNHTLYGYKILSCSDDPFLKVAADIAKEHHERVNGTGYMGLVGAEISLAARIVSVADVFDALTSKRDYKRVWSFESAFGYITDRDGTYFDSEVTAAFRSKKDRIRAVYNIYQSEDISEAQ